MKKEILKYLILLLILALINIGFTNSYFRGQKTIDSNSVSAGCWVPPVAPTLDSPSNDTNTNANDVNFNWLATTSSCPIATVSYSFQLNNINDFTLPLINTSFLANLSYAYNSIPQGEYWWRVYVKDQYDYTNVSTTFHLVIDRTAPVISNVTHLVATPEEENDYLATVTWNTDELTTSNLRWSDDGGASWTYLPEDTTADNTFHSLEITGLTTTTTYNYEVRSKDQAGNETTSSGYSFTTGGGDTSDFVATTDVVINEFLPNPIGADNALKPGGEWVELYNRSDSVSYNLEGWSISAYTNSPSYRLYLTTTNTVSSDLSTTGLTIGPHEFFVVYRNGDTTFRMSNTSDDRIRLFDNVNPNRVDRFMYTASQVIENKSIARYPDGSDDWFDPIPTPLGPNILEPTQCVVTPTPTPTPSVELTVADDKKRVTFVVKNISSYLKLSYELTYDSYDQLKGVIGNDVDVSGKTDFSKEIDLATCSNEVCTYDQNAHNFKLKITLEDEDVKQTVLQQSL